MRTTTAWVVFALCQSFLIKSSFGRSKSEDGSGDFTFINFGDARRGEGESRSGSSRIIKTVIDGERRVTLECAVSNTEQIQFHWILNDKLIQNTTRRYQIGSNLFISRITRKYDEGDFACVATNTTSGFTRTSPPVRLNIIWISSSASVELSAPTSVVNIKPGVEVILKCKVDATSRVDFRWFRNGEEIISSDAVVIREQRLHILKVNVEDNGSYDCVAKNDAGIAQADKKFHLSLDYEGVPKIIAPPQDQIVIAHSRAAFHCAFQKASVEWFFQQDEPLKNSSRYTVYSNGSLIIHEVRKSDEGNYKCSMTAPSYPASQTYSASLRISYLHSLSNSSLDPAPLVPGHVLAYPENSVVEVYCEEPKGYPTPRVWWSSSDGQVILDKTSKPLKKVYVRDSNTLIFNGLHRDAVGTYSCWAENTAGMTNVSFHLSISLKPNIVGHPMSISTFQGEDVDLNCQFEGSRFPLSHVRWLRNLVPIRNSQSTEDFEASLFEKRIRVLNHGRNSTLTIKRVGMPDVGEYICEVSTSGFPISRSRPAALNVKESLRFTSEPHDRKLELGSTSKIHCKASGSTMPEINWVKFENGATRFQLPDHIQESNGTLYFQDVQITDRGLYTCLARNSDGLINVTIYVDVIVSPRFIVTPTNPTEATEGEALIIHCKAEGDPTPTISWDRNSVMNGFDPHRFRILENGSLLITQVLQDDEGSYACTAGNSGGLRREEVHLVVRRDNLMTKTVTITLSVAAGYMLLVVGLMLWCRYGQIRRKQAYLTELQGGNERDTEMKERVTTNGCNGNGLNGSVVLMNGAGKIETLASRIDPCVKGDVEVAKSSHSSVTGKAASTTASLVSHRSQNSQTSKGSKSSNSSFNDISSSRNDLQFVMLLGNGNFGEVFLAKAKDIREGEEESLVMVKALQTREEAYLCDFKRELDMYHKLKHENVSRLVRLCREMEPHYMIIEYSDWGGLKQFLLATRKDHPRVPKPPQLTMLQIIRIIKQIALGMEHLSKLRFVHKDLATRNCLISSGLRIQVSNPSLSRDTYSGEYFTFRNQVLPIRWLPHEAVIEDDFSTKSDSYSFGVVCWEVITQASVPYTTLSNDGVVETLQKREACSKYLQMEDSVPKSLKRLLSQCWELSPKSRPTFSSIASCLSETIVEEFPK